MAKSLVSELLFSRFVDGGRGEKDAEGVHGFDCWGGVMAAFRRYEVEVPDFHEHPDNPIGIGAIFEEQAVSGLWERLDKPEAPCLVVMSTSLRHPQACNHFGVYVGGGKFFHMQRKRGPHLDKLDAPPWPRCVKSFWRWRGGDPVEVVRTGPMIPEGQAMVVFMPNFMDPKTKTIEFVTPGRSVAAYCPSPAEVHGVLDVSGCLELCAVLNGRLLTPDEERSQTLRAGDCLFFKVVPHGGGGDGKNPLAMVASIALMVVAPYLSSSIMGLTGAWGITSAGIMLADALPGVIGLGGSILVNAVLPSSSASTGITPTKALEESATYGWGVETNPTRNGSPVPILWGEKVGIAPFLLARYIETDGDKQYLNMLFLVAEGPLDAEGGIDDILIEDNPIANYSDVEFETRLGTAEQTPIKWFNDTISERAVSVKLSSEWYQFDGLGTAIEALGVGVTWPYGLGAGGSSYNLNPVTMTVEVEIRTDGGAWTEFGTFVVTGSQSTALRRFWRVNDLTPGKQDIRVRLSEDPPTGTQYLTDCYLEYTQEIIPDDFALPHSALLGIRALATDQLSGSRPQVTLTGRRSTVQVWDPDADDYVDKAANNMAWMAWDLAHHYRYGGAVPVDRIVYNEFANAAEWCDIKGITGSLYLDQLVDIQTAWDYMGRFGRFQVVPTGTRVGCVCDRPVEYPDQSLVVTEANVLAGTYGQSYMDTADRADAIRVTYFDPVKGRTTFLVVSEFYGSITGRAPRVREETLYCCNNYQLAWAWAVFMLRCNRYLTCTVNLDMSVEAIGALPGDVIQVGTVFGSQTARVTAGSSTGLVRLNATVTLESGKSYKLWVKHPDRQSADTGQELVETADVTGVLEETVTDALFISGVLNYAPSEGAVVAFGEPTTTVKWYRVVSINRSGLSKLRREISALEYADEVYADEGVAPSLDTAATGAGVSGLQAGIFDRFEDGLAKKVVSLWWRGFAVSWTVYQRRPGQTPWKKVGTTSNPEMDIYNLAMGYEYEFAVTAMTTPSSGESVTLNFSGEGTGMLQAVTALNDETGMYDTVTVTVDGVRFTVEVLI
jgi:hypothetical protein